MNIIEFSKTSIERKFREAEEFLLNPNHIFHVIYTNYNHETFDELNKDFLKSIRSKAIVYCIWSGDSQQSMVIQYIGHVNSAKSRQRMRNHLGKKHEGTGAKLQKVISELALKKFIGVSTVQIEPGYMRTSLEEWLILKNSEFLPWNKSGKIKSKKISKKKAK